MMMMMIGMKGVSTADQLLCCFIFMVLSTNCTYVLEESRSTSLVHRAELGDKVSSLRPGMQSSPRKTMTTVVCLSVYLAQLVSAKTDVSGTEYGMFVSERIHPMRENGVSKNGSDVMLTLSGLNF